MDTSSPTTLRRLLARLCAVLAVFASSLALALPSSAYADMESNNGGNNNDGDGIVNVDGDTDDTDGDDGDDTDDADDDGDDTGGSGNGGNNNDGDGIVNS